MVVTTATDANWQRSAGLRPLEPGRDLGAVAGLIAAGFGHELDDRGRSALRELRWMARLSPLVWWWAQADPSFHESMNGFVWEVSRPSGRGREIVGNVSLNRAPGSRERWIICNVVVREDWRGHGIGHQLTEAAMIEARSLGARSVLLQVFRDNRHALHLYQDLGFQEVAGETTLLLEITREVRFPEAPGYDIRPWHPSGGRQAYELARLSTPTAQQWLRPLKAEDYRPSWAPRLTQHVGDLFAGRRIHRLAAWQQDHLRGLSTVTAAFRRDHHQLSLLVQNEHRGEVEAALVGRALHLLSAMPPRPVQATISTDHETAQDALVSYGFVAQRTLLTLQREYR